MVYHETITPAAALTIVSWILPSCAIAWSWWIIASGNSNCGVDNSLDVDGSKNRVGCLTYGFYYRGEGWRIGGDVVLFDAKRKSCKIGFCAEVVFVGNGGGKGAIVSSGCGGGCLSILFFFGQAKVQQLVLMLLARFFARHSLYAWKKKLFYDQSSPYINLGGIIYLVVVYNIQISSLLQLDK